MSMINWREHTKDDGEDLCAWLLLELIANTDELSDKLDNGEIDVENINTVFTIEGVEVDFEWATEFMEKSIDRLVVGEAKKLVAGKINEIISKMRSVEDNLDEILSYTEEEVDKIYNERVK